MNVFVERITGTPVAEQRSEFVERKGIGHPDSICDNVMEQVALALSREYRRLFGVTLHHNMDKGLLVGGSVERSFGGGKVTSPMLLVFGDRATFEAEGRKVPVQDIAVETAKQWFRANFRFVDPDVHLKYQFEIRPGSAELQNIFRRRRGLLGANDTSAGVGFAPLTVTEALVLQSELYLNSREFKESFPETGEDIKIMAVRKDKELDLTLAMPLLDRFVQDERDYFDRKRAIQKAFREFLFPRCKGFRKVALTFNPLDEKRRGMNGIYLSVLGTSAEDADSGEVGRGNRVNGLITFNRPMSLEAAAGKNAVSHVGKIYNILANRMAHAIYEQVDGISEVHVFLLSRIGVRIDKPVMATAKVLLKPRTALAPVSRKVTRIMEQELSHIRSFCEELLMGKYPVA